MRASATAATSIDIVADATAPGGMGTFGWDDEGVAAASVPIVREGIFVGYLTSRETAPRIGRQSGGAMRADGWNRIPLIRMTNLNLLPKPGMSLDEIVADTDDGFYLASNRSWSIDDRRLNFQFATEIAYEIKNGKKGRLFKNPTYTGITYEFWRSCDAVGDERSYVMLGTPNCGKGEPGQGASVGHAILGRPLPGRPDGRRQVVNDGRDPSEHPRPRRAGPRLRRGGPARPKPRPSSPPTTHASRGSPTARSTRTSPRRTPRSTSGFVDRTARRGRVEQPDRRRGASPARGDGRRRSPATPRSSRTGAACPSRRRSSEIPAAFAEATVGGNAGAPGRWRPRRDRRGRCRRRHLVRIVLDGRPR